MHDWLRSGARRVRGALLSGVDAFGGFSRIAESSWRRQRLLIICYHGVSLRDEHEWDSELFVTPAFLRRRFEILRDRGYAVLPLGEAIRSMRSGTLPPRSVALTFDDGYFNFIAAAVPLLEEFGYAATNYVSTYFCVHQRPIPGLTLRYLLWRSRAQEWPQRALPGRGVPVNLRDRRQREVLAASMLEEMEAFPDRERREAWLGEVATRLGVDWDEFVRSRVLHLMTGEEIAEAARRGFDMQLHTHRHRVPRDKSAFCREVLENRRILEQFTGHPAIHFCYPSGDIDPVVIPWLRELSVETATTGDAGLAEARHDPLVLPRYVDTMQHSEIMFEGWLCGANVMMSRRLSKHV